MSRLSYKTLFIILFFLLIPIVFLLKTNSKVKDVAASWWDEAWSYRQAINISSHSTTESNVYLSTSISIGHTGKAQTDGGDFRFTDQNGQLLDYYIVSGAGTTTISFHIQFNSFPAGAQTIFAYYGNPSSDNGFSTSDFATEASNYTIGSLSAEETGGGPIAYWKFDEGVGTTTYNSINSNQFATLTGTIPATWIQESGCIAGKCLQFSGGGSATVTTNVNTNDLNTPITFSTWFKLTNNTQTDQVIVGGYLLSNIERWDITYNRGNNQKVGFLYHGGSGSVYTNTSPTINKWHHLTVIHRGTSIDLYLDGKYETSSTFAERTLHSNTQLKFGFMTSYPSGMYGFLDEVKIFPYARTATQIKQEYSNANTKVSIGTNSSGKSLSDGLVGYWKFDEGVGTTAYDSSGNNKTAVFSKSNWTSGKYGVGISFDGTFAANLGTNFVNPSSYTKSAWVKTLSNNSLNIISGGSGGHVLYLAGGSIIMSNTWTSPQIATTANFYDNQWHLITATYNGTIGTIYMDGVAIKSGTLPNIPANDTTYIGSWAGSNFFNGLMDEVRIYNRALSTDEVKQLYEYSPPPIAYYKFDEGAGTTVSDSSGNNKNGSIAGQYSWSTGKYGKAVDLGSTLNYIQTNLYLNNNQNSSTYSAWIYPTSSGAIINNTDNSNYSEGGTVWINGPSTITWGLNYAASAGLTITTPSSIYNKWSYITTVADKYDSTNTRYTIYLNGISIGSTIYNFNYSAPNTRPFRFGTAYNCCNQYGDFTGKIDEVKIYNYARTQKQILQDMQGSPGSFGKPIVHYKFDEGFGSSVTNWGSIGSTLNATFATGDSSPSWTEGKISKALSFGGNDYINVPLTSALNFNSFSMSGWFKTSATGVRTGIFKYNTSFGYISLIINSNNTFLFESRETNNAYLGVSTGSYHDGNWHHFVATRDDTNDKMSLFVDGTQVVSVGDTRTGSWNSATSISVGQDTSGYLFNGLIDDFKIYNYALSADEVKTDYNQGANFVFGSSNQTIGGTTTSTEYCVPGDTSPCSPPIAQWKFDEGVGTTAFDTSGNNYNVIFGPGNSAPTWSSAKIGKGISFNGISNIANVPSLTWTPTQFTIGFWIKPTTCTNYNQGIQATNGWGAFAFHTTSTCAIYVGTDLGNRFSPTELPANTLQLNTWQYFTYTHNGTQGRFFKNGVPITNLKNQTVPVAWTGFVFHNSLQGQIDHVQIYNYARTPAQIAYDYNRGKPIGWWKMDECQGNLINDWSGNANHGTLNIGANGTQNTLGTCQVGTSAAWTAGATGKLNSSINFDGTDDYILVPHSASLNLGTSLSASFWIKATSFQYDKVVLAKGSVYNASSFLFVERSTGLFFGTGSNYQTNYIPSSQIADGTWHHVTGVYDGTSAIIYLDGKYFTSQTASLPVANTSPLGINSYGNGTYIAGQKQLDDIRVYNYALTATQVKELYNGGGVNFN